MNASPKRLSVRMTLLLLVAIPTLATIIAAQQEVRTVLERRSEVERLQTMAEVVIAGGNLVHELQKERGMSAGYLSSEGSKFDAELPKQRQLTDGRLAEYRAAVATLDGLPVDAEFRSGVDTTLEQLDALPGWREDITVLSSTTAAAVAYYTGINTELLGNIFRLSHLATNARIGRMAVVYANFSSSKERAGIERAIFSVTFNLDTFTAANELKLLRLINEQDLFLSLFLNTATRSQWDAFESVSRHPDYLETQRYRDLAFDLRKEFGVDSEQWFRTITGKINQLRELESSLAGDLRNGANEALTEASSTLSTLLFAAAAFLAVTALLAVLVITRLRRQLGAEPHELTAYAERVAQGDLEDTCLTTHSPTGVLESMRVMQSTLRERAREEQVQAAIIDRLTRSLDKIATPVLVADAHGRISYANEAVTDYCTAHTTDLHQHLPDFDPQQLLGRELAEFAPEVATLTGERRETTVERTFGTRITLLTLNLVTDRDGQPVGTTLEIQDVTEERQVVSDVAQAISKAAVGQLDVRVETGGRTGLLRTLCDSINNMLNVTEEVVGDLGTVLEALAKGDLTAQPPQTYEGDFARLMSNAEQTVDRLRTVVRQIQQSAASVQSSSVAISDGALDLSGRTERSASSLESTAANVRELADTVAENAKRAGDASAIVDEATQGAELGGRVVDEAIQAMDSINTSSSQIAKIIGVIDEIAFQTNLLALNASVEAARAGEQGRGFAVVASEVRSLASRSAAAAQEIKSIIERSLREVGQGSDLVNRTGEKLHDIVSGVKNIRTIVQDIAQGESASVRPDRQYPIRR